MEELRKKYENQADLMATKSRFGFFSIPPSHTAAKTDFNAKSNHKSPDGKVITEYRNIFSGPTASGIGKKTYFSVPKSIYHEDPYDKADLAKKENNKNKNSADSKNQKQIFKPARLNKTLSSPAYKYICQNPTSKNPKANRKEDGAVLTKDRNICANPLSKIQQEKQKCFKYLQSPYDNQKILKNQELSKTISLRRGEGPFKAGSPCKQFFSSNIESFKDDEIKSKQNKISQTKSEKVITHQGAFKPNCRSMNKDFSYPQHIPERPQHKLKKRSLKVGEALKLSNKPFSSKPCPTIAYSMINLFRRIR